MFKRLAVANTLAAFVAASGMFFFIASNAPSGVHNSSPYGKSAQKSAFAKPAVVETTTIALNESNQFISTPAFVTLPVGSKSKLSLDNNQTTEKNHVFVDQSIDLGEIVIQAR